MIRLKTKKKEVLGLVIVTLLVAILTSIGVLANIFDSSLVATNVIENNVNTTEFEEASSLNMANTGDTTVSGYIRWTDGTNTYPAINIKVEVWDKEPLNINNQLLGYAYTNESGYYSVSFNNDTSILEAGGYDVFIKIITENENYRVSSYSEESTVHQNINGSLTITQSYNMSTNFGRALQIMQALYVAYKRSAYFLTEETFVGVSYPSGSSIEHHLHSSGACYITLPSNAYNSWDRIIQAYGVIVAYKNGFYTSQYVGYPNNISLLGQTNTTHIKDIASNGQQYEPENLDRKLASNVAWGNAWTIVYSIYAQQEFTSSVFNNVATFKDTIYDPFDGQSFEVETNDLYLGETCTQSVCAVLWDIIDSAQDSGDNLSDFQVFWMNESADNSPKELAQFVGHFYDMYPSHANDLSSNLIKYGMVPSYTFSGESTVITDVNPSGSISFTHSAMPADNNYRVIVFYSEDFSKKYVARNVMYLDYHQDFNPTPNLITFDSNDISRLFNTVTETINNQNILFNSWPGKHVNVAFGCRANYNLPYYLSTFHSISKKVFTHNGSTLTGTYCDILDPIIAIPETVDGQTITSIGDGAFQNKENFAIVSFPASGQITNIGSRAFKGCELGLTALPTSVRTVGYEAFADLNNSGTTYITFNEGIETIDYGAFSGNNLSNLKSLPTTLKSIGAYAFSNSQLNADFCLPFPGNLQYIGANAFENCQMKAVNIHYYQTGNNQYPSINYNAFSGCSNLTIYTDAASRPSVWDSSWNAGRPVVWGVSFTDNYVSSFTKTASSFTNVSSSGISNPIRDGYDFKGWYTEANGNGTKYTSSNITSVPNGTTLYAYWTKQSSCVAEGTLITLADGSQVAVEDLTGDEYLLVWNMLTGEYDAAPMIFIDSDPCTTYEIIELTFSDNTQVKVIDEHAFFDMTLGEYVFLRNDAAQYIGHYFNKQGANGTWESVQLVSVDIYNEVTTAWSPVTFGHLCFYVNGMLSMPGATEGLINIFDVDTALMTFDEDQMAEDIATYGLFTYEEFSSIIPLPELVFEAFGGQYLKVSIGKGLITFDEIIERLNRYADFFA